MMIQTEQLAELQKSKKQHIRAQILPFLVAVLVVLMGAFLFTFYKDQQQQRLNLRQATDQTIQDLMASEIRHDISKLSAALEVVIRDPILAEAFQRQDIDAILARAQPLFDRLKAQHDVTHFYFHKPDHVNLVRVHKSQKGDLINRDTIKTADSSGKPSVGLEQGPTGNPVLRYVYPWRSDFPTRSDSAYFVEPWRGELIGFVELGIEFTDIANRVSELAGMDLIVSVDKQYLDETRWEKRNQRIGKQSDWNEFPDTVVMDKTMETIPAPVAEAIANSSQSVDETMTYEQDGKTYQVVFSPLADMNGRVVGNVVALNDITQLLAVSNQSMKTTLAICLAVAAALVLFFYVLLGRIEKSLNSRTSMLLNTYNQLHETNASLRESEQRERQKAAQLEQSLQKLQEQRLQLHGAA